jgi:hypothetical protein
MFDAIKNLTPAHRFQAFLVVVVLSTLSSMVTAYMSTDDCSGLANQYNTLIKNYTETMSFNNQLVEDNNQKQKDFMVIKNMLDSLNSFEPEIVKRTTIKNRKENPIAYEDRAAGGGRPYINDSIIVLAKDRQPETITVHDSKIIKTETTVTKIGDKQKNVLTKIYDVLKKHEK